MPLRWFSSALLGIAFASGTAALVYQVVWLRWFQLLFGSTAYAASATLCAFFTGLALGAALVGRVTGRWSRPLALYGAVELGAAFCSLLVPLAVGLYEPIYAALYQTLAQQRLTFVVVKYALALAAMLPAATLLGGTLPPLAAALVRDARELGREGALLYAMNLLGAALGSALAAFWLIEALGLRATYGVGVALSVVAGAAALILARRGPVAPSVGAREPESAAPPRYLILSFASGFGILALEVLLIHALGQVLNSSVYSFGAVLVVVLLALAAGAGLVSATARWLSPRNLLLAALLSEAVLLILLPWLMVTMTEGLSRHASGTLLHGLLLAAGFGGPALLVGGIVLPLTFRLASGGTVGRRRWSWAVRRAPAGCGARWSEGWPSQPWPAPRIPGACRWSLPTPGSACWRWRRAPTAWRAFSRVPTASGGSSSTTTTPSAAHGRASARSGRGTCLCCCTRSRNACSSSARPRVERRRLRSRIRSRRS